MNKKQQQKLLIAQEVAKKRDGQCLSNEYITGLTKMKWVCDKNHIWESTYKNVVKRHSWCSICSNRRTGDKNKNGLLEAQAQAQLKKGECLSLEYINAHSKLKWQCAENHTWQASYHNVLNHNRWCNQCAIKRNAEKLKNKNGLFIAQEHAKNKGGECLSIEYIGSNSKLKWKCANNHTWQASYSSVIKGIWCNKCGRKTTAEKLKNKSGLFIAQEHAKNKGGECLSTKYINSLSKLKWRCAENHTWQASYHNVLNHNRWCNQCAIKRNAEKLKNKNGLFIAQEHAKNKGGECLSIEYIGSNSKLEWKCANNHTWQASYSSVIKGSWCPNCSYYHYKEHKIRDLLEYLLNEKFPKVRPQWNINPKTNRVLELDGYSEKLKIAFEFQGAHHYKSGIYKDGDLEYIKYKDEIKRNNCVTNGVTLIIIDDNFKLTQQKEIVDNIIKVLSEKNITIKIDIKQDEIDNIFIKTINQQKNFLAKAKKHAKSKNGNCLSEHYIDATKKLKWECIEKHTWESLYHSVVGANQWCPQCAIKNNAEQKKNKNALELAKKYALEKGGICLSNKYVSAKEKLEWKCGKNHIWENSYSGVVSKKAWCLICAKEKVGDNRRNKNGLDLAKKYALEKGGQCLSNEYINNGVKLNWQCANNHIWESSYRNVVTGKAWCWVCYNINRGKKP